MRKLGIVLLALSLVVGAAAVLGLRLLAGSRADAALPSGPPATSVVVAARPIAYGEAITPSALRLQPWPAGATPTGAWRSLEPFRGGPPRYALAAIAADEPILPHKMTGSGGRATLSGLIRPGLRASTIRIDDVMGVAGFVLPGDFVDVLVTRKEGEERQVMRTDVLLRRVRVLAVDQMASEGKNDPVVAKAATIEITPEQAQKLALAAQVGVLSLALRAANEAPLAEEAGPVGRTIREGDLAAGVGPSPRRPLRVRARAGLSGSTVQLYRGSDAQAVPVRRE